MSQLRLPVEVPHTQIVAQRTLGDSITLAVQSAGLTPKEAASLVGGADKAQYSRWVSNAEGVKWDKLARLMDACGNDAPVLWMAHARGFDLASMRRRETELERELRQVKEENAALRRVLQGAAR